MDPTRELRFTITQEMKRRGKLFQRRIKNSRHAHLAGAPAQLVMLAHGDSWFDYPLNGNDISLDGSTDIVQQLDPDSTNDENILSARTGAPQPPPPIIHNVSHWGYATTDEMSRAGQQDLRNALDNYWNPTGQKPDAILFSGGGNDIVGDQFAIYLDYAPPTPVVGQGLNMDRFEGALARVEASYDCLFAFRDKYIGHDVPIFAHAYDFAIPNGTYIDLECARMGPWLKPSLTDCGYKYEEVPQVCRAIVKTALQEFRKRLKTLEGTTNNFYMVETQGTLTNDSLWGNELHPTGDGFAMMADKFRDALRVHFPGRI